MDYAPEGTRTEEKPLPWQLAGRMQTATGYGARLTSSKIAITPDGRRRRVYVTQYANAGTAWILLNGKKHILREL